MAPVVLALTPFAAVIGVTIHHSHVDHLAAWSGSFLICAGTAQLTSVQLLDQRAAPAAIVLTVVLINARFAFYGATFARWFSQEPLRRRLLLAFPLVDQLFALCADHFARAEPNRADRRSYYVGAAAVLVAGWVTVQAIATVFAGSLPDTDVLGLAAPLVLTGLVVRSSSSRGPVVAAMTGALFTVMAVPIANHVGLLVGVGAGLVFGGLSERRMP
jgi:predicted branched-subunit amino acid permease